MPHSPNWQRTAIGLHCDYINRRVTLVVTGNFEAKCSWYHLWTGSVLEEEKKKLDRAIRTKSENCIGPECPMVVAYRDKLLREESGHD